MKELQEFRICCEHDHKEKQDCINNSFREIEKHIQNKEWHKIGIECLELIQLTESINDLEYNLRNIDRMLS